MSLRVFAPPAALQEFVDKIYIYDPIDVHGVAATKPDSPALNGVRPGPLHLPVPANGGAALTVCLSNGPAADLRTDQGQVLSGIFLTGPSTIGTTVTFGSRCSVLGVCFRSAAWLRFLGASAGELLNVRIDYRLVAGRVAAELEERLLEAESDPERIRIVAAFLYRRLVQPALCNRDWLDEAVEVILGEKGNVSIEEIAGIFNVSSRQLRRRFTDGVGMGPKVFARMKRFGHARLLLAEHPHLDLQDVIFLAGYYDQSHLLKDFKTFSETAAAPM